MRGLRLEIGLDAGASPEEAEEPLQLISDELKIGWASQRHELLKKGEDLVGPDAPMSTATDFGAERIPPAQPGGAQLVEPGFGDSELRGSRGRVEVASIEIGENAADKLVRKAVAKLLLFIPTSCSVPRECRSKKRRSVERPPLRRPPLRSGLLRGGRPTLLRTRFYPFRFCSVSIPVLYRPRQVKFSGAAALDQGLDGSLRWLMTRQVQEFTGAIVRGEKGGDGPEASASFNVAGSAPETRAVQKR